MLPWHHAHITLPDRPAGADWYARLGGQVGKPTPRSENIWYGENLLQIQTKAVAGPSEGRLSHLGFSTGNTGKLLTGLGMQDRSTQSQAGTCLAQDPWGTHIEIIESGHDRFNHIQLVCPDAQSLADWYARHLGGKVAVCPWDSGRLSIAYDSITIVFAETGYFETGINAAGRENSDTPGIIDHIGWYTADLEADAGRLKNAMVEFVVEPRQFGSVQLAFIKDPTGMWIELVEPPGGVIPKKIV